MTYSLPHLLKSLILPIPLSLSYTLTLQYVIPLSTNLSGNIHDVTPPSPQNIRSPSANLPSRRFQNLKLRFSCTEGVLHRKYNSYEIQLTFVSSFISIYHIYFFPREPQVTWRRVSGRLWRLNAAGAQRNKFYTLHKKNAIYIKVLDMKSIERVKMFRKVKFLGSKIFTLFSTHFWDRQSSTVYSLLRDDEGNSRRCELYELLITTLCSRWRIPDYPFSSLSLFISRYSSAEIWGFSTRTQLFPPSLLS